MKIKLDLDDDLALKKMLELHNTVITVRAFFYDDNKYCAQDFLVECLYNL